MRFFARRDGGPIRDILESANRFASSLAGPGPQQILVATHHKALTVFMRRVFRDFAGATGRSCGEVDPRTARARIARTVDIVFDGHSRLDTKCLQGSWVGLHVIRDPRDLLVSSCDYHKWSQEAWLQVPQDRFGGLSYQQALNRIDDEQQQFLFELKHAGGSTIRDMLAWDTQQDNVIECRFENLLQLSGVMDLLAAIEHNWTLEDQEVAFLAGFLIKHHKLGYRKVSGRHIQNPEPGKWKSRLGKPVLCALDEKYPQAVSRLGWGI